MIIGVSIFFVIIISQLMAANIDVTNTKVQYTDNHIELFWRFYMFAVAWSFALVAIALYISRPKEDDK